MQWFPPRVCCNLTTCVDLLQLRLWMEQAGMHSWVDVLGNVHGVVDGSDPKAPVVVLGSHYDTIVNAGK